MGRTTATAVAKLEGKGIDTTRGMEFGMRSGGSSVRIRHIIYKFGRILGVSFIVVMKYVESVPNISQFDNLHDADVRYTYKAWITEKIEAVESGMAMPNRSSTIEEAGPSESKRSRKMSPTAKTRPSGSAGDVDPKPSARKPTEPDQAPPEHMQTKDKTKDKNKISVKVDDQDQWIQDKIAEASTAAPAADDGDGDDGRQKVGDETPKVGDGAPNFGFEPSWNMAIEKYGIDTDAQMQLALLRDIDWYAAAEIVWKLTKKAAYDDELRNPSGFVNRCCTTARKNLKW